MDDRNHCPQESTLTAVDHVTVVFHKVASHGDSRSAGGGSEGDHDGGWWDEAKRTEERTHLRDYDCDAEKETGSPKLPEEGEESGALCPPAFCVTRKAASVGEGGSQGKPKKCPGKGLFYAFLSTVFFSMISLLVKTIKGVHALEISGFRCFFQMLFIVPLLIYHKTGFLGPRDKRIYLMLRGFLGSNAMMLLFYAVQQMPLADATVIMFSNPVFTSLLAWIFLKEKCTLWDCVFTVFTLTGVILIARPPFLFGEHIQGIEGNYANHIKGTIAAFAGAIGAACTMVVLRKIGKSVHYYLSVWYYAVIGFIQSIIMVTVLGEWKLPYCGQDRWMLMLIAVLGIAGQTFLTKALQLEKAGPVALMRTVDVVLAFFFQFIFLSRAPTWLSLGGALCIVLSTSGVAIKKWFCSSRKS
ncbi:solute carrier family 35 member G1 [Dunckerocampus dactyliophorus]|uniref:solute carrier family 35 member G1 n=1 Tax=Dunckerocampus dactyliophorus TaxID=161453 RepID=UPI002405E155|nr:solute carrier family 35 member G1 [Dunckerocampus dactyliophorus]